VPSALVIMNCHSRFREEGEADVGAKEAFGDFSRLVAGWKAMRYTPCLFSWVVLASAAMSGVHPRSEWGDASQHRDLFAFVSAV